MREHSDVSRKGRHAVVIGGSMAGLLAARILLSHFDRVTVIERDHFPDGPEHRKGVPQARYVHILLMRGLNILKRLFPGLDEELIAAGAIPVDIHRDFAWHYRAGWGIRFDSDQEIIACSRDLLEWSVRRRLAAFNRVTFLEGSEATGLLAGSDGTRVTGVRVHTRNGSDGGSVNEYGLDSDLIVDASGRGSRAPQWLQAIGYEAPDETVVNAFLGYSSRIYARPADFQPDLYGFYIQLMPPEEIRGGTVFPIEGNRWIVNLIGSAKDYPPIDETGFIDFARSLPSPMLYDAIKGAEPLSPIYGTRGTENRIRHYERLTRWPEGFVIVGDAACAFNPVYGQGMSVSGMGAATLHKYLREQRNHHSDGDLSGFACRFQRKLAKVNEVPWLFATSEDFRVPGTVGGPPGFTTRVMHRYLDQLLLVAAQNSRANVVLADVLHLIEPPITLFRPDIVASVLQQAVARRLSRTRN